MGTIENGDNNDYEKLLVDYKAHYYDYYVYKDKSAPTTNWAVNEIDNIIMMNPKIGLDVIIKLINRCDNNDELAFVAAGPLEDIILNNGKIIMDKLEREADNNIKLQFALSGVWIDRENEDIYPEWERLMKRYGYIGNNPKEGL